MLETQIYLWVFVHVPLFVESGFQVHKALLLETNEVLVGDETMANDCAQVILVQSHAVQIETTGHRSTQFHQLVQIRLRFQPIFKVHQVIDVLHFRIGYIFDDAKSTFGSDFRVRSRAKSSGLCFLVHVSNDLCVVSHRIVRSKRLRVRLALFLSRVRILFGFRVVRIRLLIFQDLGISVFQS